MTCSVDDLWTEIRSIPDYPRPGIDFKDITPLLGNHELFEAAVQLLVQPFRGSVEKVAGIEARGFILGAPAAYLLGVGFVPMRKPGKLPGKVYSESYKLEYGEAVLELDRDALRPGQRVLIVDDVIATGGTVEAAIRLVRSAGAVPSSVAVLLDLCFPEARSRIDGIGLHAVLATREKLLK